MAGTSNRAQELLLEFKRSTWLQTYNEESVRQCLREIKSLNDQILHTFNAYGTELEAHRSLHCAVIINHQSILRSKRCVVAYLNRRLHNIRSVRWTAGSVLPPVLQKSLSTKESEYFVQYDDLLTKYMGLLDMDITADILPPRDLYIEVRVLQDCGELYTQSGPVNLTANSTHFLRRVDVEHLIRSGAVVQVARD